ncbi:MULTISPECIES: cbb3-type cytochrome c oxidase subunit I [Pontibacillus]|uniref:Cbb3-type cytochrome c oxidase subunit I n=1 Tax=Pontibacillus chungwhensis TaxID=265426 RepID=A0ABY8URK4_9BACI|nr:MULTISPECIES: cbb3-type cytochrome c oxidase subunit I [Pontibacillus]MCD5322909.1 cbb3-type cytochrome c oxidase subunit I [Pontibacillus sp. HN14]WIF96306.1 cbb3-type cytochrome c oxidase subunit I [Pontibacillus chungwhensis]
MAIKLIKISALYFLISVVLGLIMSITHDYRFTPVHVHMNLLGWTSLTLAGILYYHFPALGQSLSGKIHFWLHNIGLPIMMISLFLLLYLENDAFGMGAAIGSTVTVLGIIAFVWNICVNLKAS